MTAGRRLCPDPSLAELRRLFRQEFACLPERHKMLKAPEPYDVRISEGLGALQERTVQETTGRELRNLKRER
jgi:hypothetical protein